MSTLTERIAEHARRRAVKKARKEAGIDSNPVLTGNQISLVKCHWGHSFTGWAYREATETITMHGWSTPRPRVGDTLLLDMKINGLTEFIVLSVEYMHDPMDMWYAHVEPLLSRYVI